MIASSEWGNELKSNTIFFFVNISNLLLKLTLKFFLAYVADNRSLKIATILFFDFLNIYIHHYRILIRIFCQYQGYRTMRRDVRRTDRLRYFIKFIRQYGGVLAVRLHNFFFPRVPSSSLIIVTATSDLGWGVIVVV